jgi:hypothetical protein
MVSKSQQKKTNKNSIVIMTKITKMKNTISNVLKDIIMAMLEGAVVAEVCGGFLVY